MKTTCRHFFLAASAVALAAATFAAPAENAAPVFAAEHGAGRLAITRGGQPVADYFFKHPKVPRPFFSTLRAPDGTQLTRNFPPQPGDSDSPTGPATPGVPGHPRDPVQSAPVNPNLPHPAMAPVTIPDPVTPPAAPPSEKLPGPPPEVDPTPQPGYVPPPQVDPTPKPGDVPPPEVDPTPKPPH